MIIGVIVFSSIFFAVLFSAAWVAVPSLRDWIERPKYRFQANVQSYDKVQTERMNTSQRDGSR